MRRRHFDLGVSTLWRLPFQDHAAIDPGNDATGRIDAFLAKLLGQRQSAGHKLWYRRRGALPIPIIVQIAQRVQFSKALTPLCLMLAR